MALKSSIEWTDATWNPVRGCTKISPGCKNCYAETFAERWRGVPGHPYEQGFDLRLVPEKLTEPLKWKKPRRVFVNSMSDLFQDGVPFEYVDKVFAVMALCPQHTFQVLTKRPERMLEYFTGRTGIRVTEVAEFNRHGVVFVAVGEFSRSSKPIPWPLANVWLGVSVENHEYADKRIPLLLQTPAAKRFVSYEPALGPVDFTNLKHSHLIKDIKPGEDLTINLTINALTGDWFDGWDRGIEHHRVLDWIIVGGESGPGARPFDLGWARSVVQQCRTAGVACFVKQLGAKPDQYLTPQESLSDEPTGKLWRLVLAVLADRKGGSIEEWPSDLRVREFPEVVHA